MDRIIEVKVCGSHLTKDTNKAGTKGEANMTRLRITFDENWEDFAKRVIFWDAYGQNPVKIVLGTNLIEDIQKNTRVYLVPIPAEAMARAGWLTFSIQGTLDNKNQVTITSKLEVNDSPDILDPLEPTPSELEQIQAEMEAIKDGLKDIATARDESMENARLAKESADMAVATAGKSSYIGDDGYWYVWDMEKGEFCNSGVKAQSGSTVYMGANPPEDADVWIDNSTTLYLRNEDGVLVPLPYIRGENGKSAYELAVENGYKGSLEQFTTLLNNLTYTIEADHLSDTNNPHRVTAKQVGALPVEGGTLTGGNLYLYGGTGRIASGPGYIQMDAFEVVNNGNYRRKLTLNGKQLADLNGALVLSKYEDGKETRYALYGEHNKPKASDVGAVSKKGDTMTGALVIDKDDAWGQLVIRTPSGYFRCFETDDDRVRIDVRDEQDTTKRRYIDIFTNTGDSRHSHALRFVQTRDGVSAAAYVLHTENINDFVISGGNYTGTETSAATATKTIPIRKTTKAIIFIGKVKYDLLLVRGCQKAKPYGYTQYFDVIWEDESVTIRSLDVNRQGDEYFYTLIG